MSRLKCNMDEAYFVMLCLCVYLFVVCFVFCFCKISKLQFKQQHSEINVSMIVQNVEWMEPFLAR